MMEEDMCPPLRSGKRGSTESQAAMVEAVAKALAEGVGVAHWNAPSYRHFARLAIAAARPFIENEALERAAKKVEGDYATFDFQRALRECFDTDYGYASGRLASRDIIRSLKHSDRVTGSIELSRGETDGLDGGHPTSSLMEGERG